MWFATLVLQDAMDFKCIAMGIILSLTYIDVQQESSNPQYSSLPEGSNLIDKDS